MQRVLNTVSIAAVAALLTTPASAGFFGGFFGGGRGAPGPEAAVGLPFLAIAGAYALLRKRRAAK